MTANRTWLVLGGTLLALACSGGGQMTNGADGTGDATPGADDGAKQSPNAAGSEGHEICGDGKDNDGDGKPDNGCVCVVQGATHECEVPDPNDPKRVCDGVQTCGTAGRQEELVWGDCAADCETSSRCADGATCDGEANNGAGGNAGSGGDNGNGSAGNSMPGGIDCNAARDEATCYQPLDIVFVLDHSGSMEEGFIPPNKMDTLKGATDNMLNYLSARKRGGVGAGKKHRVGMTSFPGSGLGPNTAGIDISLGSQADIGALSSHILGWQGSGNTPLKDALTRAVQDMGAGKRGAGVKRVFVVLSDGDPTPMTQRPGSDDIAALQAAADDVYSVALYDDACIFCGLQSFDESVMQSLVPEAKRAKNFKVVRALDTLDDVFIDFAKDACVPDECK